MNLYIYMYMYMCMYFKVYTSVLTRMGTFTDVWVHVFSIDVGIHIYIYPHLRAWVYGQCM